MKPAYTRRSNANSKAQANMTHPGTINAIQTCNAAIHGPWKHLTKLQIKYKEHHKKQENIIWAYIYIMMTKCQKVCKESGQKGLNSLKINVGMRFVFFGRPDSKSCLCKRTKQ